MSMFTEEQKVETIYFKDEVKKIYDMLPMDGNISPIQSQVLGYNVYQTLDGEIVLTALEKKSWQHLIENLMLPLELHDRFSRTEEIKSSY